MKFSTAIILGCCTRVTVECLGLSEPTFWSAVTVTLGVCVAFPLLRIAEALEGGE